jgi:myo-inositol 2-dehydrogenase/D-chiro-inositol 1-dehydrogenase
MINFCLFGAGRIGRIHAGNLTRHGDARLRYVVDVSADAAQQLARSAGAEVTTAASALADPQVDAVLIASSTDTHAELIQAAADAGKAIFCEKPLDLDRSRAQQSLARARQAGVVFAIGFNRRYDPSFNRLKQEISSGKVGAVEVISITSRDPSPPPLEYVARSGGLFRDMMIHDLDMARWLLGEEPVEVFARGAALVDSRIAKAGDIDTAIAVLGTASGKMCQITNSRRCAYGYDQRIEVFGSAGMVRADNQTTTSVESAGADGFTREPALPFFLERYAAAYRIELDEFLKALRGEPASLAGGEDGLRALLLADAAQRSLETGAPVKLG